MKNATINTISERHGYSVTRKPEGGYEFCLAERIGYEWFPIDGHPEEFGNMIQVLNYLDEITPTLSENAGVAFKGLCGSGDVQYVNAFAGCV